MSGWPILAAGIKQPTEVDSSIRALVAGLGDLGQHNGSPAQVVAAVAEQLARQADISLCGHGLRLFDQPPAQAALQALVAANFAEVDLYDVDAPFVLGRLYELLLAPLERRRAGAHLTSGSVARGLVGCVGEGRSHVEPLRVLDPAVGGAAFLLAAASRQRADGHDPDAIFDRLFGVDIDPVAVAIAEAALSLWLVQQGRSPRPNQRLQQGDGLVDTLPVVDLVLGNPPFLNQLQRNSARTPERRGELQQRWGDLAGAYTDDAWLFLAAGMRALDDDGVLVMVQPLSILAARHASPVRELVRDNHVLSGLWVPFTKVFDAAVDVCAVVVQSAKPAANAAIERWSGADFVPVAPIPVSEYTPALSATWGPLAAEMQGVPVVAATPMTGETVGDMATVTAGFRQQFYGLKPHVNERHPETGSSDRLVTVGMIDPLVLLWGRKDFSFAGHKYREPVLDLESLGRDDASLLDWTIARRRPKVLVATQTRIIETWVDIDGHAVPATPVISVEPHEPSDVWLVAAVLNAPVINAWVVGASFGLALSINAMKFSAKDLASLPLPKNRQPWESAARLLSENVNAMHGAPGGAFAVDGLAAEFAGLMSSAYGDTSLASQWWHERLVPLIDRHR